MTDIIPADFIERRIFTLRGVEVMLSPDLADIFQVEHKALNQAVKRNSERFPADFMFQLTSDEWADLRRQSGTSNPEDGTMTVPLKSQIVTSNLSGRGGVRRAMPYAFTEHGCVMLANVLRSERAVQVSIAVVRAFVRMRRLMATNRELARRLEDLEQKHSGLAEATEHNFRLVMEAIRDLINEPEPPPKEIGFRIDPIPGVIDDEEARVVAGLRVRPATPRRATSPLAAGPLAGFLLAAINDTDAGASWVRRCPQPLK